MSVVFDGLSCFCILHGIDYCRVCETLEDASVHLVVYQTGIHDITPGH